MTTKRAQALSRIAASVFILFGLLGFLPNPIVGADGYFLANTQHNLLNLVVGAILLAGSGGESRAAMTLFYMAGINVALAILTYAQVGFTSYVDVFGVIRLNFPHAWLHASLGVLLAVSGLLNTARQQLFWD